MSQEATETRAGELFNPRAGYHAAVTRDAPFRYLYILPERPKAIGSISFYDVCQESVGSGKASRVPQKKGRRIAQAARREVTGRDGVQPRRGRVDRVLLPISGGR